MITFKRNFGVKGLPSFWNLQANVGSRIFDCYENYVLDSMHNVFLGVVHKTTTIWLAAKV